MSRLKQHLDGMGHSTPKITGHCKRLKIARYVVYGEMLCSKGDERCLFMSLLYAGVVLCLLEILGLLEVFGFLSPGGLVEALV